MGHSFAASELLSGVRYDESKQVLTLFMREGKPRAYKNVSKKDFIAFLDVEDKDAHFHAFVRTHDRVGTKPTRKKSLDSFF